MAETVLANPNNQTGYVQYRRWQATRDVLETLGLLDFSHVTLASHTISTSQVLAWLQWHHTTFQHNTKRFRIIQHTYAAMKRLEPPPRGEMGAALQTLSYFQQLGGRPPPSYADASQLSVNALVQLATRSHPDPASLDAALSHDRSESQSRRFETVTHLSTHISAADVY
ncbi:hypothetical protein CALCODRAFT_489202 [Calocera cornea HHB12733]|uniref:Uncharacterized protein n=1 Tax=Calocera cornea HHB12733 TaxID=1353952 RepID=A0A166JEZ7_9BASI|nr:hypothetical protein CALCODRAFT_489202 [Calocera cornea HHB12733]